MEGMSALFRRVADEIETLPDQNFLRPKLFEEEKRNEREPGVAMNAPIQRSRENDRVKQAAVGADTETLKNIDNLRQLQAKLI